MVGFGEERDDAQGSVVRRGGDAGEEPGERLGRGGAVVSREGGLGRKDAEGDLDEVGVVGVVAGEHESALGAGVAGLEVAERAGERAGEAGGKGGDRGGIRQRRARSQDDDLVRAKRVLDRRGEAHGKGGFPRVGSGGRGDGRGRRGGDHRDRKRMTTTVRFRSGRAGSEGNGAGSRHRRAGRRRAMRSRHRRRPRRGDGRREKWLARGNEVSSLTPWKRRSRSASSSGT